MWEGIKLLKENKIWFKYCATQKLLFFCHSLIYLDAFFSFTLIFALFLWTNVMQLSKQSLVRWRQFHGYHCSNGNTHIKNGGSFKEYSKFTLIIHIDPNSYSFRTMFIMIIVRFFIICLTNGWKYESGHKLRQGLGHNWCNHWPKNDAKKNPVATNWRSDTVCKKIYIK